MNRRKLWFIVITGIILRLIFAYFFTYSSDFRYLLLHSKSIAMTGNLFDSMGQILPHDPNHQLYGKIWFQINSLWMNFLVQARILTFSAVSLKQPLLPYQQFAMKLIQLPYDILLLYFMAGIARKLKIRKVYFLYLFWSFNPLWVYIGYSMFQADIAMMAAVTGGTYLLMEKKTWPTMAALFLFAFGSVIKLMPLLLMPVVFIYLHRSWKTTFFNILAFCALLLLFVQPWSRDFVFMKKANFNSYEAVSLFHEQWNGASIFALIYLGFLSYFWIRRDALRYPPLNLLIAQAVIYLSIYIGETYVLLYPQFMMWLMPAAAILVTGTLELFPILLVPLIGFYAIAILNSTFFTGAFSDWLGSAPVVTLSQYFSRFLHEKILLMGIRTGFVALTILSMYLLIRLFNKKVVTDKVYVSFARRWAVVGTIIIYNTYFIVLFIDWLVQKSVR